MCFPLAFSSDLCAFLWLSQTILGFSFSLIFPNSLHCFDKEEHRFLTCEWGKNIILKCCPLPDKQKANLTAVRGQIHIFRAITPNIPLLSIPQLFQVPDTPPSLLLSCAENFPHHCSVRETEIWTTVYCRLSSFPER